MNVRLCAPVLTLLLLTACGGWVGDEESNAAAETTAGGGTGTAASPAAGAASSAGTTAGTSSGTTAGAAALSCNTAGYVAGAVELPTAAQLTAYAGTYDGDEGQYGPNPGDPFVKSGAATVVFGADGALSYKGKAYALTSVCIDKVAGPFGKVMYLVAGQGHLDIADKVDATLGNAWGVSLADGTTIFTKAFKR